jgi:hypothetical protein
MQNLDAACAVRKHPLRERDHVGDVVGHHG